MMRNLSQRGWVFLLLATAAVLACLLGLWSSNQLHSEEQTKTEPLHSGFVLAKPKVIAPFSLHSTKGKAFNNQSLKGHFSVLFFGFTHCPQMCPTTLSALSQAYGNLAADKHMVLPQVVFVSIDPERDHIKDIKQYLSSFHADFMGAVADERHLLPLKDSLGVLAMKSPMPGHKHDMGKMQGHKAVSKDYNVDHSGTILVINPEGQLQAILTPPHGAKSLASDLARLLTEHYHPKL